MEQLAHFVTKSFEYNNNRVLDVINMSTKSLICDNLKSSDSSDNLSNGGDTDMDDDADTVDIDITDMSSNDECESAIVSSYHHAAINNNKCVSPLPISLIKKGTTKDSNMVRQITTKNWLISDTAPRQKSEGKPQNE